MTEAITDCHSRVVIGSTGNSRPESRAGSKLPRPTRRVFGRGREASRLCEEPESATSGSRDEGRESFSSVPKKRSRGVEEGARETTGSGACLWYVPSSRRATPSSSTAAGGRSRACRVAETSVDPMRRGSRSGDGGDDSERRRLRGGPSASRALAPLSPRGGPRASRFIPLS